MNKREILDIKGHKCPIRMVYGNSRLWGASYSYDDNDPRTPYIAVFLKSMTPLLFFETLNHELFHHHLDKIKRDDRLKWNIHQEHWVIDKLLNYSEDWY